MQSVTPIRNGIRAAIESPIQAGLDHDPVIELRIEIRSRTVLASAVGLGLIFVEHRHTSAKLGGRWG
jgi:hypothetical protein